MSKKATGTRTYATDGTVILRVSLRGGIKISVGLYRREGDPQLDWLQTTVNDYARTLHLRGSMSRRDIAAALQRAVEVTRGVSGDKLVGVWERMIERNLIVAPAPTADEGARLDDKGKVVGRPRVRDIAGWWLSGEITKYHPKVVHPKRHDYIKRTLEKYVYHEVGDLYADEVSVAHFNQVYTSPAQAHLMRSSRILTWRYMTQIMSLAEWPLEVITQRPNSAAAKPEEETRVNAFLQPADITILCGCQTISVHDRVFYGFLAHEGTRVSEARSLRWMDIQLMGTVGVPMLSVYRPKTGTRGRWILAPGMWDTLQRYRERFRAGEADTALVFETTFTATDEAWCFRRYLTHAGVTRAELYDHDPARKQFRVRAHDLRGLFVTVCYAAGQTDEYVRARTGHSDVAMLELYKNQAELLVAMGQTAFAPLTEVIPELRTVAVPPVAIRRIQTPRWKQSRETAPLAAE